MGIKISPPKAQKNHVSIFYVYPDFYEDSQAYGMAVSIDTGETGASDWLADLASTSSALCSSTPRSRSPMRSPSCV